MQMPRMLRVTAVVAILWAATSTTAVARQLDALTNVAACVVSTGYDAAATSIVVASGCGAGLPTVPFNMSWCNTTDYPTSCRNAAGTLDPNYEVVRVTARTTDTLTVTRGQEATTGSTKNTASKTYWMSTFTAKTITDISTQLVDRVVGPASATDNAVARFDTTTGKLIQNSVMTVSDAGAVAGVTDLTWTGATTRAGDDAPAQIAAQQDNYSVAAGASVVRVDADVVRAITGIAGGADGREIRFINDGAGDSVLIFRREDAASTAANRIDMASDIALGPKESITLWYNSTDSRWNLIGHTASPVIMARYLPFYSHEMNHNGSQNPWDHPFFALGAGSQSKVDGVADHPGIWRCTSAAAANTGCNLQTEFAHTLLTGGEFSEVVFRVNTIAGTRLSAGFHDSSGGTGSTDAATFHIVEGGDASCRTANNNTTTTTSLGVTLTVSTWYRARVDVNNDATTVTCTLFSATGDQLATVDVTTNIPTGAGRVMGHAMTATVTTATAQSLVDIDYMAYGRRRAIIR